MPITKAIITVIFLFLMLPVLCLTAGCSKEYSYERKPVDSVAISIPVVLESSACAVCNNTEIPDLSWRFSIDGVVYCGKTEKAIITLERTSFTFFGPSSCSDDSGFVASVYIDNNSLDKDRTNVLARLSCYYYDKVTSSYMFMSQTNRYPQLTIATYDHDTGMTTGTFEGPVVADNGVVKEIKNGKFRIRF